MCYVGMNNAWTEGCSAPPFLPNPMNVSYLTVFLILSYNK